MLNIAGKPIGKDHQPYIIAEMSGNHNQSLERAIALVDAAANAGAHAIKLQTFTPETMTLDTDSSEFQAAPGSLWAGRSLYSLYAEASTPWEWHAPIMHRARERGITCFSSPFDESAVDFLETLDVPAYKIASFECVDLPLIRRVAQTGKPVIISTGMATIAEIAEAVETARSNGCTQLILLKCTSTYPASPTNTNIRTIPHMRDLFRCEIGLSDHTMGVGASVAAVALGATVIEKHFTLNRKEGGVDSAFSLEPEELTSLVVESERAWQALGEIHYGATASEEKGRERRRSIYVVRDISEGEAITTENIRRIRPGYGLAPRHYDNVLGRKTNIRIPKGTPLTWDMLG
jgi:pseudaminic acid synthase